MHANTFSRRSEVDNLVVDFRDEVQLLEMILSHDS
jgi:hypothetical protein